VAKKSVKLKPEKHVLYHFYNSVHNGTLENLHLFHSDIYYIREALFQKTGKTFSLSDIEESVDKFRSAKEST
jgi:hypothetical protein|tara:strand:+ start:354 stop:569 length:216 start_codon:yes stop_codon:yes gene_type:complete